MVNQTPTIYYTESLSKAGEFIAIVHGESGYNKTNIPNQDWADALNKLGDITPVMVKAAIACSMSDNWDKFTTVHTRLAQLHQK